MNQDSRPSTPELDFEKFDQALLDNFDLVQKDQLESYDNYGDEQMLEKTVSPASEQLNSPDSQHYFRKIENDEIKEWQKAFEWDKIVEEANTNVFGNESFRENQREIINATKSGKNVLALIPTGGGKSLTFQLSALTDKGVTFVIMPLISLIEDNSQYVLDLDIRACVLTSRDQSIDEMKRINQLYE